MTGDIVCPKAECGYEGSIAEVAEHIDSTADSAHSWLTLEYDHEADFRTSQHLQRARSLREAAEVAADAGNYDEALDQLENAVEHYDEAKATLQDTITVSDEREAVIEELERVKQTKRQNRIEQFVATAGNELDTGDAAYADGEWDRAAEAYDEAISVMGKAQDLGEEMDSVLEGRAQELLEQAEVRKESLDGSDAHRDPLEAVRDAKAHKDAGDTAFKQSNQQDALEEYRQSLAAFKRALSFLEALSFESHHSDDQICDICHAEFDRTLESVSLGDNRKRQVCPACSRFAPGGVLPTPADIDIQTAVIEEDIDSIEAGEYGTEWTSMPDDTDGDEEQSDEVSTTVDEQQLLIELVGVYQSVEGLPTAEDLDDRTEYGYLVYQEQFGSIENALGKAGFEM